MKKQYYRSVSVYQHVNEHQKIFLLWRISSLPLLEDFRCKFPNFHQITILITLHRKLQSKFQLLHRKLHQSKSLHQSVCHCFLTQEHSVASTRLKPHPLTIRLLQNKVCGQRFLYRLIVATKTNVSASHQLYNLITESRQFCGESAIIHQHTVDGHPL